MPKLGEYIFQVLHQYGVQHAFGIPGDYVLSLFDVLTESEIQPIVMTHEPSVGFAADVYARIRGLGVAVVTYGVGGLNMINPIAGAYAEKSPVVVLSGSPGVGERQKRDLLHHKVKTFDSQRRIYEEVTLYAVTLDDPFTAAKEIHKAIDYALKFKRPVYLEIPRDRVYAEIEPISIQPQPIKQTDPETLDEAIAETIAMVNQAKSPVILAGVELHRFNLQEQLLILAEKLGCPVVTTVLGKSVFPEAHPQYLGIYNGVSSSHLVQSLVEESDCLLMLGTFLTDINLGLFTAHLDVARTISVNSEIITIKHHEYHHILFEDFIQSLCHREDLPHSQQTLVKEIRDRVFPTTEKISMGGLIYELNQFIDENTVFLADPGDCLFAADDIWMQEGTSFFCPAYYASMGFAIPGAIGAYFADPFRRPIALVGDGSFQMTGMELLTAKHLGINPIVIVTNNASFATLRAMGHQEAKYVNIPTLDYAKLAELMGGNGFAIETRSQFRTALHEAKKRDNFSILDVRLSPEDISPGLQKLCNVFAKTLKG